MTKSEYLFWLEEPKILSNFPYNLCSFKNLQFGTFIITYLAQTLNTSKSRACFHFKYDKEMQNHECGCHLISPYTKWVILVSKKKKPRFNN